MKRVVKITGKPDLLLNSLSFIKTHWAPLLVLSLIAAFGRVIQLGGFGQISSLTNVLLEIVIELSRVAIFLYVIGIANIKRGISKVKRLFSCGINLKAKWTTASQKLKTQWLNLTFSFLGFLLIAGFINFLIDQLAYQTCFYLTLKNEGLLVDTSAEWTILLFFKNLSVIPFTLVFETLLLLWLTNKFPSNYAQQSQI